MDGFWHMGFTVRDLDASIAFYCDVIGMQLDDLLDLGASEQFEVLTGNPGARTRLCFLSKPVAGTRIDRRPASGTFTLQLWQYDAGAGEAVTPAHNKIGCAHLAFFVDDVEAEYRRLTERGDVNITGPLVRRETSTSFYLADPDGLPIELWEERAAPPAP